MSTQDHPDWWKNVGGSNAQDSTLERRSLIWNDNGIEDGIDPPAFFTCATDRGKFFTRGCRGMIEEIQIYCRDAGVDRLTLRYSPHPCIGPIGEVTITPLAGWSWVAAAVEEMWNYDSLFIWIHACQAGTDWAYDTEQPYDGHTSDDNGATWRDITRRPFFRVVYTGQTPGDVPVSGIVNTIEIPSVGTRMDVTAGVAIPNDTATLVCTVEGAGTLLKAHTVLHTAVVPAWAVLYYMMILVDGVIAYQESNRELTQSYVATSGRNSMGEFFQATEQEEGRTEIVLRAPIKFRRSLRVFVLQQSGAGTTADTAVFANMVR